LFDVDCVAGVVLRDVVAPPLDGVMAFSVAPSAAAAIALVMPLVNL
jgi:hypothetical protein